MNKNIKKENNNEALISFLSALTFGVFAFCCLAPIIFKFTTLHWILKGLMILGSCFGAACLIGVFYIQKKKLRINFILIWSAVLLFYLIGIVHYFSFELWGIKYDFWIYFVGVLIMMMAIIKSYDYAKGFTKDLIIKILLTLSIFNLYLGCFSITSLGIDNNIYFKIGLGGIYLFLILSLVEAYLLHEVKIKIQSKFKSAWIFLKIVLVILALFTLPLYINWLGLNGDAFDTFIQIYCSVVGAIIALVGVSWTIKEGNKSKQNEEALKNKPWFTGHSIIGKKIVKKAYESLRWYDMDFYEDHNIYTFKGDILDNLKENQYVYQIAFAIFENSDQSNFIIDKVTINNNDLSQKNILIKKNDKFYIENFYIIQDSNVSPTLTIYARDLLNKKYAFRVAFNEYDEKIDIIGKNKKTEYINTKKLVIKNIEEINE